MNYLAHIFLSGKNTDIQIGNFMGDAVKGKDYLSYPADLRKGILLHRQIDSFTDQHPIVKTSKKRLQARYGHYGGVLIDIFYDHFLAVNWSIYSKESFTDFTNIFYKNLERKHSALPEKTKLIAPKLIAYTWLDKYQSLDGISQTLNGMTKRIKHNIPLHLGIEDLVANFSELEADFNEFFPLLQKHSTFILHSLDKQNEENTSF